MADNLGAAPTKNLLDDEALFESSNFVVRRVSPDKPARSAPNKPEAQPKRTNSANRFAKPKPIPRVSQSAPQKKVDPFQAARPKATRPKKPRKAVLPPPAPQKPQPPAAAKDEHIADAVIRVTNLFTDDMLTKRFRAFVDSYVHGVRTKDQLSELLQRSVKIGGLGVEEPKLFEILAALDAETQKRGLSIQTDMYAKPPVAQPEPAKAPKASDAATQNQQRVADVQRGAFRSGAQSPALQKTEAQAPTIPEAPKKPPTPAPAPKKSAFAKPAKQSTEKFAPPKSAAQSQKTSETPASKKQSKPVYGPDGGVAGKRQRVVIDHPTKQTVTDVRAPSVAMGPVDELRNLDVKEWRRLGASPSDSAEFIQEKMEVLGQERFAEKLNGIAAWQESPIYKLYVTMGRESMVQGKSLAQIAEQRSAEKQPYLTEEEFQVIADLNQSLRF